jgi:DNA replication protein DnaC
MTPNSIFPKFRIQNYECPRCKKSEGYLALDGGEYFYFCGENQKCLDDDAHHGKLTCPPTSHDQKRKFTSGAESFSLGARFENANLSEWIASEPIKKTVIQWLRNPSNFLLHQGVTGCGKTYFSAAMLNYLWDRKEEIYYTQIRRLIQHIQTLMSDGTNQYETIQKISGKKILIIDDLGASTNSDWQQEMILDIIDTRYEFKRPTIITTNLTNEELHKKLGARTASRLLARENLKLEVWDIDRRGI